MTKFICLNCGFESEKQREKCLYCGKEGEIIKEKTATELIDEAKKNE